MPTIGRVLGDVVDDYGVSAASDLVADRGLDLQLSARLQPKLDLVAHRTDDPARFRDPRDSGEAHPCHPAYDVEDFGNRADACDGRDIGCKLFRHRALIWDH